ncbi:3641_t:CDS:2, partial [Gigaspora rosea]
HNLNQQSIQFLPQFRKLSKEMLEDIRFWTYEGPIKNDASNVLNFLLEKKANNPEWIVEYQLDPVSRSLLHLLWMEPLQVELYIRYSSVVAYDNTAKTNIYGLPLSIFIVVDNNYNTRPVAQSPINYYKDINAKISCETTCIDEVFDLLQTSASTILSEFYDQLASIWEVRHMIYMAPSQFVFLLKTEARFHINMINHHWLNDNIYGSDLNNRNFIRLVDADTTSSATQFPIKWISIENNEVVELSRQKQGLTQQRLKAKQRFAKAFGLAKAMINKAIELDLDKKLITILEDFMKKKSSKKI